MSFIESAFDDLENLTEDQPVPEGEYELVIDSVKEKKDDSGNVKGLLVVCVVNDKNGAPIDGAANVLHNISFKLPGDDDQKARNKALFMKRFLVLFGIPFSNNGFNLEDFPGKRAKANLTIKEYEGTPLNQIKLPNLK